MDRVQGKVLSLKELRQKKSQKFLADLAGWLHRHYALSLVVLTIITVVAGFFASKLEQKTTVRDLLPSDNEKVRQFEETVTNFGLVDRVMVVLEFDPKDIDAAEYYAEILTELINEHQDRGKYLHWMVGDLFKETGNREWHNYLQYLARLLPDDLVPRFQERLSQAGMDEIIEENRRGLGSGLTSRGLIQNDPLNLMEFASGYRQQIMGNYRLQVDGGFLVSKNKDMLLLLGKPLMTPEQVEFSTLLKHFLEARIEQAHEVFAEEEGVDSRSLFKIGLTGPHPITARENELIRADIIDMFVTSFVMVLMLFVFAYRRPMAIVYVGIPLLCAEIWTLGLGYVLFGRLNLLTAAFSAVIVGLGIDYAIHIFSRYLDERLQGYDPAKAMAISLSETGMGTLVGGLTTALAFLAMGISNFSGLREFSIIASLGIVLCLVAMFILLPVMVFWRETWRRKDKPITRAQWDFHVEKLLSICLRHKKVTLTFLLLGTVFLAYQAAMLRFDGDLRSVRARSNEAISLQNEVTDKIGGSLRSLTFVLAADTEDGLYAIHEQLMPVLAELQEKGSLVRSDSLLNLLRKPLDQEVNLAKFKQAGLESETMPTHFQAAMTKHGFRMTEDMQGYIQNLAAGFDAAQPVTLNHLLERNSEFIKPFLSYFNHRYHTIVYVYPSIGLWEKNEIKKMKAQISEAIDMPAGTEMYVTGIQTISDELNALVQQSFKVSSFLAVFLIMGAVYFHFRKWSLVAFTLLPLMVSLIWMLGTMKLLGISITVLNFVATPLIVGIGIDDGVHIVEKYLHRKGKDLCKIIAACGKAITLTSLTTIFGFSSLFLADYAGFQSLGLCAIIGVFSCWLGSVILLPLLLDVFKVSFVRNYGENESSEAVQTN